MTEGTMLTKMDARLLSEAFPKALRDGATQAGEAVLSQLHERQWTERFAVQVDREVVSIPARLHFAFSQSDDGIQGNTWLMGRCLRTRSNDGFERQRALRDVLSAVQPWSVPFIVALMGEYVVEMLIDIEEAMSPALLDACADFISANPDYWQLTRQRITSYWNVYYRTSFRRSDYVGFRLIDQLQAAGNSSRLALRNGCPEA